MDFSKVYIDIGDCVKTVRMFDNLTVYFRFNPIVNALYEKYAEVIDKKRTFF